MQLPLLLALALPLATAHAHGDGHAHEHPHTDASPPRPVAEHPIIPDSILNRLWFQETFQSEDTVAKWVKSEHPRYVEGQVKYGPSHDTFPLGFSNDDSLGFEVLHKHYGLSRLLDKPFDNTGKDFVAQMEVRLAGGITCSGAYLKFLTHDAAFKPEQLTDSTPYTVMFGPDKCGQSRLHVIVRQRSPVTGSWEEKHLAKPVAVPEGDTYTHLYTLVIRRDNSFSVYVDLEEKASGSLLSKTDFSPPFGQPKQIPDPTDKKPADWVEVAEIPDPTAVKPADWDDDAPAEIPDPDAVKPEGWDDDEDGAWEAPRIANPAYKGKWSAPIIPNPAYKGPWAARLIDNPNYFEDDQPANLASVGAVAVEILVNDAGISFDNIVLSHDESAAREFAEATFVIKSANEKRAAEEEQDKRFWAGLVEGWNESVMGKAKYIVLGGSHVAMNNILAYPLRFAATILAVLGALIFYCCFTGAPPPPPRNKAAVAAKSSASSGKTAAAGKNAKDNQDEAEDEDQEGEEEDEDDE